MDRIGIDTHGAQDPPEQPAMTLDEAAEAFDRQVGVLTRSIDAALNQEAQQVAALRGSLRAAITACDELLESLNDDEAGAA